MQNSWAIQKIKSTEDSIEGGSNLDTINKILFAPGYIFLFLAANFPTEWGEKRNVSKTGRQWKNRKVFAPLYSIIFYFFAYAYLTATP